MLPREWTRKSQAPVWKAAAIASWAFSLILAQCLVIVLAWPGLTRPAPPPPPSAPEVAAPAVLPVPLPAAHNGAEIQISNSLARVRCLVNVGRSQEALAETIRCLTLCQRAQIDPPADLPALFAQTVTNLSNRPERPLRRPSVRPQPQPSSPPQPVIEEEERATSVCGRVPGPAYPLAHLPRPRYQNDNLAQLPEPPQPMSPPAQPPASRADQPGPYSFQPNRRPQGPPPGGGFPPPPPGYDSAPSYPSTPY